MEHETKDGLIDGLAETLTQYVEDQRPDLDEVMVLVVARKGPILHPEAHIRQVGKEHEEGTCSQPIGRMYEVVADAVNFGLSTLLPGSPVAEAMDMGGGHGHEA